MNLYGELRGFGSYVGVGASHLYVEVVLNSWRGWGLGVFLFASERLGWQVRCRVLFFALTISWDPQKADALG